MSSSGRNPFKDDNPRYAQTLLKIQKVGASLIDTMGTTFENGESMNFVDLLEAINLAILTYYVNVNKSTIPVSKKNILINDVLKGTTEVYVRAIAKYQDISRIDTNVGKVLTPYDKIKATIMKEPFSHFSHSGIFHDEADEKESRKLTIDFIETMEKNVPSGWVNMANVIRASSIAIMTFMLCSGSAKKLAEKDIDSYTANIPLAVEHILDEWIKQLEKLGMSGLENKQIKRMR